jgi:hypothetical protein
MQGNHRPHAIRARVSEFVFPPIDDGLVLGRRSPIGHVAIGKAMNLLSTTDYSHLAVDDEVIGDILVRSAILRKVSQDQLIGFVLKEIKPLMGAEEIIHLHLDVEVLLESVQR